MNNLFLYPEDAEEEETKRIYCTICESAYVETRQEITKDTFYCCNMCREFENSNGAEVRVNNFDESKTLDYAN